MSLDPEALLRRYLNDHLAGASGAIQLTERCRSRNAENALGDHMVLFRRELVEDRGEVVRLMEALGFEQNPTKNAVARLAELVGRLKPNGALASYSPLSRVLELEMLIAGVQGKLQLWEALSRVANDFPAVRQIDVEALKVRGRRQIEELQRHHAAACQLAFSDRVPVMR